MKFPIITLIGVLAFVTYFADKAINQFDEPKPIQGHIAPYQIVEWIDIDNLNYEVK